MRTLDRITSTTPDLGGHFPTAAIRTGLGEAAERLHESFDTLHEVHREVATLADVRTRRRWTADEYDRYLALLSGERRAVRAYLAAHRAFDAVRLHSLSRAANHT